MHAGDDSGATPKDLEGWWSPRLSGRVRAMWALALDDVWWGYLGAPTRSGQALCSARVSKLGHAEASHEHFSCMRDTVHMEALLGCTIMVQL
jgi:hypothetical protein